MLAHNSRFVALMCLPQLFIPTHTPTQAKSPAMGGAPQLAKPGPTEVHLSSPTWRRVSGDGWVGANTAPHQEPKPWPWQEHTKPSKQICMFGPLETPGTNQAKGLPGYEVRHPLRLKSRSTIRMIWFQCAIAMQHFY